MPSNLPKWFKENLTEEVSGSTLFKFNIQIGKEKIEVDMRTDLDVNYENIRHELESTPSIFAYWAAIYSELRMQSAKIERQIKARRGKLIDKVLEEASSSGVRITDKQVQAIIESDEVLNLLEVKLMIAQKHTGKMYFMIEAIKMKSDNLRSLAGFARMEYGQQG